MEGSIHERLCFMTLVIGVINQVLTLSGLASIRMFLPFFLYFLTMRLTLACPDCTCIPELIRQLAEHTPAWQVSPTFLTILGILAAAELVAMRNPDVKQFLVEDFDQYAKPVLSMLLIFGVVTPAQDQEVKELINSAEEIRKASFDWFTVAMILLAGGMTGFCCRIRSAVLEKIHAIDPEGDLGLQSLSNYLGEIALLAIFLTLIFLPALALVLTGIGVLTCVFFQRLWAWYERKHSHPCTACAAAGKNTSVSDCALICPECETDQPDVRRVGWFGFSGSRPLEGMSPERHALRLLTAHRCRWCASPLSRSHSCPRCGREQWTDELRTSYVRQTDLRCSLLLLIALGSFVFPAAGLLLVLILFRPLAVRPLTVHLSAGERFLTGLAMMYLKLVILAALVILSVIPGMGLLAMLALLAMLLPFAGRYLYVRAKFLRALKRTEKE